MIEPVTEPIQSEQTIQSVQQEPTPQDSVQDGFVKVSPDYEPISPEASQSAYYPESPEVEEDGTTVKEKKYEKRMRKYQEATEAFTDTDAFSYLIPSKTKPENYDYESDQVVQLITDTIIDLKFFIDVDNEMEKRIANLSQSEKVTNIETLKAKLVNVLLENKDNLVFNEERTKEMYEEYMQARRRAYMRIE